MNNIFIKSAVSLGKLVALVILFYLFLKLIFAENAMQLGIGLFVLILITLPTIFVFFFKTKFLLKHPKFIPVWKIARVIYLIAVALYVLAWCVGMWRLNQAQETQKAIEFINSKKITLDDVMGTNLPSAPDKAINDSTIAGIDANGNYIRDDVELAIFEKYPDSAKIRAAALQYAQALQLDLTKVFNSETLVAVIKKESLAYDCLAFSMPEKDLNFIDKERDGVKVLISNTDSRKEKIKDNRKYMTTYSLPNIEGCDIGRLLLPN